jgi:hypothetical protein
LSWWAERKPAEKLEIEPVVDREAEALREVHALKAQMDCLDAAMLEFRTKYSAKVSRFGVLLSVNSASMTGYAAIRNEWDALLRRRDRVVAQWHSALRVWSELKEAAK